MSVTTEIENAGTTPSEQSRETAIQKLGEQYALCQFNVRWFGTTRSLSENDKQSVADGLGAKKKSLVTSKKILDTNSPEFKELVSIRGQARSFWLAITLPYPEEARRMIRRDMIAQFGETMEMLSENLKTAASRLQERYEGLKAEARESLGPRLFREEDYPASIENQFQILWSFPPMEAPQYLLQINSKIYESEVQKVKDSLQDVVSSSEAMFASELRKLVAHLLERIGDPNSGKTFHNSTIENFSEFFDRFRALNIGSNKDLDKIVEDAKNVMSGVSIELLRLGPDVRTSVTESMKPVLESIDALVINKPRRNISR